MKGGDADGHELLCNTTQVQRTVEWGYIRESGAEGSEREETVRAKHVFCFSIFVQQVVHGNHGLTATAFLFFLTSAFSLSF